MTPVGEAAITLKLLSAVEEDSSLSQRSAARELGVALGLVNSYLKRCARKGLIKVSEAPANRFAYYLTPKGFAEKSRLTREYLSVSFNFFRGARDQCSVLIQECADRGWRRVALAGAGDLAEIATLCARDTRITLLGIVDDGAQTASIGGYRVVKRLGDLGPVDAVIITDFDDSQGTFDRISEQVEKERVLAPRLLNITREPATLEPMERP